MLTYNVYKVIHKILAQDDRKPGYSLFSPLSWSLTGLCFVSYTWIFHTLFWSWACLFSLSIPGYAALCLGLGQDSFLYLYLDMQPLCLNLGMDSFLYLYLDIQPSVLVLGLTLFCIFTWIYSTSVLVLGWTLFCLYF